LGLEQRSKEVLNGANAEKAQKLSELQTMLDAKEESLKGMEAILESIPIAAKEGIRKFLNTHSGRN
jgi:hypothetical protein